MEQLKPRKHSRAAPHKKRNRRSKRSIAPVETRFVSAFGDVSLHRYPSVDNDTLRAWSAADEYLLQYLKERNILNDDPGAYQQGEVPSNGPVLIYNDAFGGLSVPLSRFNPVSVNDSYNALGAIRHNLELNDMDPSAVTLCNSVEDLASLLSTPAKLILYKLPKSNALLEYQLHQIRSLLSENTVMIAAGMTRHVHRSTMAMFETIIGDTHSTHAYKKSRLIISRYDANLSVPECHYPSRYHFSVPVSGSAEAADIMLINHAAVFSGLKPDIGTIFFLQHVFINSEFERIVDLGCGNGVVGIAAAEMNKNATIVFTDESYMAVESARLNFIEHFADTRDAEFLQTDCLTGVDDNSVDMVLCNPPFHQDHVITDAIAWRMFHQSFDKLRNGGELWVIGNRHLGYHAKLKRLFGNVEVVASNSKFSIMKTVRYR
jgi:23S rRNA (guanine1835-N2)-methyltransferase